jgi:hypothetical protein
MSINIRKAQNEALASGFDFGGDNITEFTVVNSVLEQYAEEFLKNISYYANNKKVVSSGDLINSMVPEIIEGNGSIVFRLKMIDYYDFPNEGVKGLRSSKNAPKSPYRYRNYGVPQSMKDSLKKYIQSGKAKITSVMNDKALGKGGERKGLRFAGKKTLIDTQVATLGYLIKRFGIKSTNYFTDAFNKTFEDFEVKMFEAVESGIIITFENIKLRDGNK